MNPIIEEILKQYKKIWALNNVQGLLSWDLETYMPEKNASYHGETVASISLIHQNFIMNLKDSVEKAAEYKDLSEVENGIVRVLKRSLHYYTSIPPELLEQLKKVTSEASVVWRQAKKSSDFSKFSPYLSKIVDLNIQVADKLGYEGSPYNALLDLYEEGFTVNDANTAFSNLLPESKSILNKIMEQEKFSKVNSLEYQKYGEKQMRNVNEKIVDLLGMPTDRFRLDISTHPFTVGITTNDVRITTRYEGINFKSTLFSVIHECGHAIYELQKAPDYSMTPVSHSASLGVHESQSRFWENIIGRSREFVTLIYPILNKNLRFIKDYDIDEIFTYFNTVTPGLIRVDADEVTYNFHIALRYEIEKKLINKELDVNELPSIWNEFMDKYLGVVPKKDGEGVLQDIHWSGGSFGYFPTYSLGNMISTMISQKMRDLEDKIRTGNFGEIKGYLFDKVHKYGAIYSPKVLLTNNFGEAYTSEYLIRYFKQKYIS